MSEERKRPLKSEKKSLLSLKTKAILIACGVVALAIIIAIIAASIGADDMRMVAKDGAKHKVVVQDNKLIVYLGDNVALKCTPMPKKYEGRKVTFVEKSLEDPNVLVVRSTGSNRFVISAVGMGDKQKLVFKGAGHKEKLVVKVESSVESLSVKEKKFVVKKGETVQIEPVLKFVNKRFKNADIPVTYTVKKGGDFASVDSNGKVTTFAAGKAKIKVSTGDKSKTVTVVIQ